ncbi:MAG: hypothetical protein LBP73_03935 [Clostridiales Family XIII bacterium]|nr:hypothetical protein [Clostridiales Family XIII bacterium]
MKKKSYMTILLLCAMLAVCGCGVQAGSEPEAENPVSSVGETDAGNAAPAGPAEPLSSAGETAPGGAAPDGLSEPVPSAGGTMLLSFERISENVTDAKGNVLARMYMDKPVLSLEPFDSKDGASAIMNAMSGTSDGDAVISRINAYFEEDVKGFFYGSEKSKHFADAEGWHDYFFESVAGMREGYGDEALADSPLFNTVDSAVAYMSDEMLSIKQSTDWMAGGVRNLRYYGSTFDLRTGELLALDRFVNDGKEEFEAKIFSELRERFFIDKDEIHDYEYFLAQLREKDIGEHEFYYDGQNIHLIFNEDIATGMGFILRYPD